MTDAESLVAAIHEDVTLCPYDPAWPALFGIERGRLLSLFPTGLIDIQHIGSTAVYGFSAKPVIDILAGVASMSVAEASDPELAARYSLLKSQLAATHRTDREAYTDAKSRFIADWLEDA